MSPGIPEPKITRPNPTFFNTRHTRTRHSRIRVYPNPPEPDFFHTRPITNLWFKGKIESLPEDTRYPKFQYPPEPDFSNTRHTRTRHLKIRVYPNPPEPDFFHTRPITNRDSWPFLSRSQWPVTKWSTVSEKTVEAKWKKRGKQRMKKLLFGSINVFFFFVFSC